MQIRAKKYNARKVGKTMKISISNFRKIRTAELDASKKITLIAGRNGEGKTSTLQAIAAALAGTVIPIDSLKKNQSAQLINTGSAFAQVSCETPIGSASVKYPENSRSTDGVPPPVSDIAAEVRSFVDMTPAERVQYITGLMRCEPRREDLAECLGIIGINAETIDRIWQTIQSQGWDGAHKAAKESGSKLKGAWEEISGDRYGDKKAETWIPREWESDLQTLTEQQLREAVTVETQWLEAAISDAAVDAAELERLRKAADAVPGLQDSVTEYSETLSGLRKNHQDISAALEKLPAAVQPKTHACPHCNQPVAINGDTLSKPTLLTEDELQGRAAAIKSAQESLTGLQAEIARQSIELGQKQATLQAAQRAAKQLAEYKPSSASTGEHKGVEDCRARVKRARDRLAAWTKWQQAAAKHRAIVKNQSIINELAPDGLRQRLLKTALDEINKTLAGIAAATGWEPCEIEQDMSISLGDYQYILHSQSKQYRIRVSLQLAFSGIDGSQIVLIDGADILDGPGRNGLFRALSKSERSAIVGMTFSKQEDVPAIEKLDGAAYWVENGTAAKIRG